MEGHQRAIMGNMTVEQIYKDRKTFSTKVFEVASMDLHNMGISVISYTLKDVRDEVGYLASLGQARTAQVELLPDLTDTFRPFQQRGTEVLQGLRVNSF